MLCATKNYLTPVPLTQISDQPVKETLLVILLMQRKKSSILARATNFMFLNPVWTPSSLQYHLPYLTAVAQAHPTLNTPGINYSPSSRSICMGRWMCPFPYYTGGTGVYAI